MGTLPAAGADAPAPSGGRFAARRDLAVVVLLTAIAAVASAKLNLSEAVIGWARPRERFQLDELPGVLLVLAICLLWFSLRRYLEARRELRQRRRAEGNLAVVLSENRRLAQQYLQIQESERRALARDLHDELGQYLNVVKVDVASMRDRLASIDPLGHRTACETIGNIDRVQRVLLDLIRQLRPVGLDELGLAAAVEHCVAEWRRRLPEISIGLTMTEHLEGLDEMRRLAIYRLVQEALTNVTRHSKASQVEIRIAREDAASQTTSRIVVRVADNGIGADSPRSGAGLGLIGMRERLEAVGGSLLVTSSPSGGFTLHAEIPVMVSMR